MLSIPRSRSAPGRLLRESGCHCAPSLVSYVSPHDTEQPRGSGCRPARRLLWGRAGQGRPARPARAGPVASRSPSSSPASCTRHLQSVDFESRPQRTARRLASPRWHAAPDAPLLGVGVAGCRGGRRSLERGTGCLSRRPAAGADASVQRRVRRPPSATHGQDAHALHSPAWPPGGGSSGVVPAEPAPPLRGRRWKEGGSRRESGDSRVVCHLPPAAHLNTRCSSTCRFPNRKKPHRSQPCVHNTESFGSLEPPLWPGGAWRGLVGPGSEAQGSGSSSSWRRLECQKQADKTKQNTRTLRVPEAKRDPSTVPALRCPPGWPPFCTSEGAVASVAYARSRSPRWKPSPGRCLRSGFKEQSWEQK